jgi:hypothetical protein
VGALRRPPSGIPVTRRTIINGKIVEGQSIPREYWPVDRNRWRRNQWWEVRERWHGIWLGWEKPGLGMTTPSEAEREEFRLWLKVREPLSELMRARYRAPLSPWDW